MSRDADPLAPLWLLIVWCVMLGLITFGVGTVLSLLLYGDGTWWDHPVTLAIEAALTTVAGLTSDRSLGWLLRDWPRR